jgi:hypothetical protein
MCSRAPATRSSFSFARPLLPLPPAPAVARPPPKPNHGPRLATDPHTRPTPSSVSHRHCRRSGHRRHPHPTASSGRRLRSPPQDASSDRLLRLPPLVDAGVHAPSTVRPMPLSDLLSARTQLIVLPHVAASQTPPPDRHR